MADLSIASASLLTGTTIDVNDLLPVLDVSASSGSKGSKITLAELFTNRAAVDFTANHLQLTASTTNTGMAAASGYSLTGSDATTMIDLAATWNTTGAPTGIRLNITDTASAAGSEFLNLQRDEATQLSICKDGAFKWGTVGTFDRVPVFFSRGVYGDLTWYQGGANNVIIGNPVNFENEYIILNTFGAAGNGGVMLRGFQNNPDILQIGQDNATNPTAQTFKAHNVTTGTGASLTLAGGTGSVAGGDVNIAVSATTGVPTNRITISAATGDITLDTTSLASGGLPRFVTVNGTIAMTVNGGPILNTECPLTVNSWVRAITPGNSSVYVNLSHDGSNAYLNTNTGTMRISCLPTSATGLDTGTLWNNAGVVNVV